MDWTFTLACFKALVFYSFIHFFSIFFCLLDFVFPLFILSLFMHAVTLFTFHGKRRWAARFFPQRLLFNICPQTSVIISWRKVHRQKKIWNTIYTGWYWNWSWGQILSQTTFFCVFIVLPIWAMMSYYLDALAVCSLSIAEIIVTLAVIKKACQCYRKQHLVFLYH